MFLFCRLHALPYLKVTNYIACYFIYCVKSIIYISFFRLIKKEKCFAVIRLFAPLLAVLLPIVPTSPWPALRHGLLLGVACRWGPLLE